MTTIQFGEECPGCGPKIYAELYDYDVSYDEEPTIVFPVLIAVGSQHALICPICHYIFEWVTDLSTIPRNTKSHTGTNQQPEWLPRPQTAQRGKRK